MKQILLFIFSLCPCLLIAQKITIQGKVIDNKFQLPLSKVLVETNAHNFVITDSLGLYSIETNSQDSIYFTYYGKSTLKFPVAKMTNNTLDIMLHVNAYLLTEIKLRPTSYRLDSLQNREEYKKLFDYKKPSLQYLKTSSAIPGELGFALDLDQIIESFQFKKIRNMEKLRDRLIEQEQEKYIKNRFTKRLVFKITKLKSPNLEIFMREYEPSFSVLKSMNDLELAAYIQRKFLLGSF